MTRGSIFVGFALIFCSALRADVMVSTNIALTGLTITPDSGSVSYLPGTDATAFGQVFDDPLGNSSYDGPYTVVDSNTSANTTTGLASGGAAVSAPLGTMSGFSGVALSGTLGRADSDGNSELEGTFEILDGGTDTNPVNVSFAATLAVNQSLLTDIFGVSATSETTYQYMLPDLDANGNFIGTLLFYDSSPLTIGSNSTFANAASPTLSSSALLQFNTPYSFFEEVDAESSGVDSTPEPSTILLMTAGLTGLLYIRRRN
jgi:hypothetical protein